MFDVTGVLVSTALHTTSLLTLSSICALKPTTSPGPQQRFDGLD
uniref:Uncharacterized protein n=1 Tax=Anguilla anguilla TaxID=7936 RepID=A0A0E9PMT8_ANGAN